MDAGLRRRLNDATVHALLIVIVVLVLFPLLWLYLTSVRLPRDVFAVPPKWIPEQMTLDNFRRAVVGEQFYIPLANTMIVALVSTVAALAIGSLAAYGLVKIRHSGALALIILSFRMFPPVMIIIPLFVLFMRLGLIDTRVALILAYIAFQLPFVIWMMRSFFSEVPSEIEESAKIDGCSPLRILTRIVLPIAVPGLAAVSILTLIVSWNEYMFALVITRTMKSLTMPVAINQLITFEQLIWTGMAAESVLFTLPILAISIFIQKHIIRGLTMGAFK